MADIPLNKFLQLLSMNKPLNLNCLFLEHNRGRYMILHVSPLGNPTLAKVNGISSGSFLLEGASWNVMSLSREFLGSKVVLTVT